MKKTLVISLCLVLVASVALTKEVPKEKTVIKQQRTAAEEFLPKEGDVPRAPAQGGTTWMLISTFDQGPNCITEGWTEADVTFPTKDYWHVDDFGGLGGGDIGLLVPIGGSQSMWCGTRPDSTGDLDLCGYVAAPGYGNGWLQNLCNDACLAVGTGVWIEFDCAWDAEPTYDWTNLQIDECDNQWRTVYGGNGTWDATSEDPPGTPNSIHEAVRIDDAEHPTGSLRIRFQFDSDGAASDYDGWYPSDGGFILDNVIVYDTLGTLVPLEDFEGEAWGSNTANDWESCNPPGYGSQAFLLPGLQIVQEDPCDQNFSCVWGFFETSTYDYTCGGWPGQRVVPYGDALDQYIQNHIWSPVLPVPSPAGSLWEFRYQTYRDLLIPPLVFYDFYVRSWHDTGGDPTPDCPGPWYGDIYVYYGPNKDWHETNIDDRPVGQWIEPGADGIQVSLACRDMCGLWGGGAYNCQCHSHSPVFDNVWVYNVLAQGPQWNVVEVNFFQDRFPNDGTITGTGSIDIANDKVSDDNITRIQPGDSMTVSVKDPDSGLGFHVSGDTASGAAAYCYISVDGPHANGGAYADGDYIDDTRYNVVGTVAAGGRTWIQIQMDTTFTDQGAIIDDRFCIDLNDTFFTPGDSIYYFFGAKNNNDAWTWYSYRIPGPNVVFDIEPAASYPDEVNILPALGRDIGDGGVGGDILYVDGMDDRGGQVWFDTAFQMLGIYDEIDRYDIIAPSSGLPNHPTTRAPSTLVQVTQIYRKIIWNGGYLSTTWNDATDSPSGKSNDVGFIKDFLDYLPSSGGVYVNGDAIAEEWDAMTSADATALRNVYMNFVLVSGDHKNYVNISPWVVGVPGGIYVDPITLEPDTFTAYGGCNLIKDFDVIDAEGAAVVQANYHQSSPFVGPGLGPVPSTVSQVTTNIADPPVDVGFVLEGFGFQYIRDWFTEPVPARVTHMYRTIEWLGNPLDEPVSARPTDVAFNELRQNRPNPFNPITTIEFRVKHTGPVSLKIYNVAGQLVRTLVDNEQITAGTLQAKQWKGVNDAGQQVSSGVYFYKLIAKDFTQTKKMILLK